MLAFLLWWLVAVGLGWIAFPLCWRLLGGLPDRGLGVSKALGLLAAGYLLWAGASLGVLANGPAGAWLAVVGLAGLAGWLGWSQRRAMGEWLTHRRRLVVAHEVIFLLAFAFWAFVRANNPQIQHTEKPMEMAFLSAILRSARFPPHDPWLAGYAISYYYFGYVLLALLTQLTGVLPSVAFNLGNAMWFALAVSGAYTILYNLIALRRPRPSPWAPLLGPAIVLLMGNLEVVLDVLHHRHYFWQVNPDGSMSSTFWSWLNINRLAMPPSSPPTWVPDRFLWWWQASRVIQDVDLAGRAIELIDEFPFFSFLLADNHPHLLVLPFVFLAIALSLHIFLSPRPQGSPFGWDRLVGWASRAAPPALALVVLLSLARGGSALANSGLPGALSTFARTAVLASLGLALIGVWIAILRGKIPILLSRAEFWLAGWLFGALAFLNTWDLPIYFSLLGAVLLWKERRDLWPQGIIKTGFTLLGTGMTSALFYLLWFPTFSSQAGGILPNLIFPTRLVQFAVMFGGMLVPLLAWLIVRLREGWRPGEGGVLVRVALGVPLGLLVLSWLLAALAYIALSQNSELLAAALAGLGVQPPGGVETLYAAMVTRRLTGSWTALLLGALMGMGVVLLRRQASGRAQEKRAAHEEGHVFVFLLVIVGSLLVMGPEFFYLRDAFGTRMNTVFKLYFAGWIMWGLATAYAAYELLPRSLTLRSLLRSLVLIPLVVGFLYTGLALKTKTENFNPPQGRTLDGMQYLSRDRPGDYAAIRWINENLAYGVVAEAVGPSYSEFGRVSTFTGLSAVLEWPGHELQWRGGSEEQGTREADLDRLYTTPDWQEALRIVEQYDINYVYIGPLERQRYKALNDRKFSEFMDLVYEANGVMIYARR